jgi:hypothetical protein
MAKGSALKCVLAKILLIQESDLLLDSLQHAAPIVLAHRKE